MKRFRRRKQGVTTKEFAAQAGERCIEQLERGVAPWQKGWDKPTRAEEPPYNPVSDTRYKGLNSVVLRMTAQERGYSDPRWMTFKHTQQIEDAHVRKGEKGTRIEFWSPVGETKAGAKESEKPRAAPEKLRGAEERRFALIRTYTVFNAEQIENMPPLEHKPQPQQWEVSERGERLLQASGAKIEHQSGDRAFYRMSEDKIVLPKQEQFRTPEAYYSTAMHELGHWTGHKDRLNRETLNQGVKDGFGSENYAKEELRAEMTSMTVNGTLGLPHEPERHAAYAGAWIKALKDDPDEIRHAARDAGQMADYILQYDRQPTREVTEAPRKAGDVAPTPERQITPRKEQEQQPERSQAMAPSR